MLRFIILAACVAAVPISNSAINAQTQLKKKTAPIAKPFNPNARFTTADLLVKLTNDERTKAGLKPLTTSKVLTDVAYAHAGNMAAKKEMNHTLDGKSPAQRVADAKYDKRYGGENISFGYATPDAALVAWMNSAGHRKNILNPEFTAIGVGIRMSADGVPYYCQVFGRP